jgi:hypothetical protein
MAVQTSFSLALNQSNVVNGTKNSIYEYTFPSGGVRFTNGFSVALQSLNIYYSWENINITQNNNTFSYIWPVGPATINLTIPSGFYTIAELNSYLQFIMVSNNHYLIDSSGNYVYYLELTTNSTLYAVQFNSFPIPTALPVGYTAPVGWPGYPVVASTPQLVVPTTNFRNLIGFAAGTYPPVVQATNYSATSSFTPQVSPVSSVFLLVNLVNNRFAIPNSILYNFSPDTTYGSIISVIPPYLVYSKIQEGNYTSIRVSFVNQNFAPLEILDSNLTILLAIKPPDEKTVI